MHQTFKLLPGVEIVETPALNQAGISECQAIRFKPDDRGNGLVEKLGGWSRFYGAAMPPAPGTPGIVRQLHAWEDTNAAQWLAVGMDNQGGSPANGGLLYVLSCLTDNTGRTTGNSPQNITPVLATSNGTPSFTTTTGSSLVTITDPTVSGILAGSSVFVAGHVAVGGLVLYGPYSVVSSSGANVYQIQAHDKLGQPLAATSAVTNGGALPVLTTVANSPTVSVLLTNHGYAVGDTFTVMHSTTLGGATFYGNYIVNSVVDANNFTFLSTQLPTGAATGPTGAGNITLIYGLKQKPPATISGYGVGGYGAGGYGTGQAVAVPPGISSPAQDWFLDNWGEILVACPDTATVVGMPFQPIYSWSPTSGDPIAVPIPEAPTVNDGIFVAMPQRQIIAWGSTFTGVQDPLLVRWCDIGNFHSWIGNVVNQAGSYRIPKGSKIISGMQGPQQGLLWTDIGLWGMQYISQPYIYSFNEIGAGCGMIARKAAAIVGGVVYWMSQTQFFKLAGDGVAPVNCPVWDIIFQNLDLANLYKIRAAANAQFGEISWFYPPKNGTGEPTAYVKYNVYLDKWDYGNIDRSAWINQSLVGPPIGASPLNGFLYQHEISPDADGQPLPSSFKSGFFVMSEADRKIFVDEIWPDMKWGYFGSPQNANVSLTFYARDFPDDTPLVYGPFSLTAASTFLNVRLRARLLQIGLSSADAGSWWRIGGMRYRAAPDGRYG